MAYTRVYKIENLNFNGVTCKATIYDTYSFVNGLGFYAPRVLNGGGNPISIATLDSNEDKYSTIRAKRCTLTFNSNNSFNLTTFMEGEDNRWWVFVDAGTWNIFQGYLVIDDCKEPYQPHPNLITLTATDNLGTLKEVPLTDFEGKNPKGKHPIVQYIAWALAKTGMKLDIRLIHNLVEESSADNSPCFKDNYLDAKTFEGSEIGVSVSCYEVLQRIFAYDCFIQQRNAEWWILRIDEMQAASPVYAHLFNYEGVYIGSPAAENIEYEIGSLRDSHFINADQEIIPIRKHKFDKLTFNYNFPKEIVDNIDFSRGAQVLPVLVEPKIIEAGTINEQTYTGSAFLVEDWVTANYTNAATTSQAYIIRYFFEGYEKERFLSINPRINTSAPVHFVKSNRVDMHYKDRFEFSVDWRLNTNMTGGSGTFRTALAMVELTGDDGKKYYLSNSAPEVGKWKVSTSILTAERLFHEWNATQFNELDWQTVSVSADPLPVSGYVTIYLQQSSLNADTSQTHFTNLRLSYDPYINGGYGDFKGHYNKTEIEGNYKANTDDEVHIGDSPKKLLKGAIFKIVGGNYVLTGKYYNAAVFRTRPTEEYFNPYGKTQIYAVHNQFNRTFRMITGSVQNMNIQNGNKMPDSMRLYAIAETGSHAEGRRFMAANFGLNLRLGEWQASLIEVYSGRPGEEKSYSATHEFKYV